jgi:hypothetical protein
MLPLCKQGRVDSGSRRRSQFWSQLSPFATVRIDVKTPTVRTAHSRGRLETSTCGLGKQVGTTVALTSTTSSTTSTSTTLGTSVEG